MYENHPDMSDWAVFEFPPDDFSSEIVFTTEREIYSRRGGRVSATISNASQDLMIGWGSAFFLTRLEGDIWYVVPSPNDWAFGLVMGIMHPGQSVSSATFSFGNRGNRRFLRTNDEHMTTGVYRIVKRDIVLVSQSDCGFDVYENRVWQGYIWAEFRIE